MATRDVSHASKIESEPRTWARGIRLSPELWIAIEDEAAALNMTSGELLRRKLGHAFHVGNDVQKSTRSSAAEHAITLKEVPDDDD